MFFKERKNEGTETEGGGVSARWQNGYFYKNVPCTLVSSNRRYPIRRISPSNILLIGTDIKKGCETLLPLMMEEGSFVGLHIPR